MKKIIRGGLICDGTGRDPFVGDVFIEDDRIAWVASKEDDDLGIIGAEGRDYKDAEIIDAAGMAVTPGFIDIHRHHDLAALFDPDFGRIEVAQGITLAVAGNCGLGGFPNGGLKDHPDWTKQQWDYIEPCLGKVPENCDIESFPGYLDALEQKDLRINTAAMLGAGAVTMAVKGFDPRPFTEEERKKAVSLVEEAMERGAAGLSFGIMYIPECYLTFEDRVALAKAAAIHNGTVCTHIRGEGDSLVPSIAEVIEICKTAGARLNVSHFKVTGVKNWGKGIVEAIKLIEAARAEGMQVTCDAYPYVGGATTALSLIPPSVIEGKELSFLGTAEGCRKLAEEIYRKQPGWDNMVESIGFDRIVIGSVTLEKNRRFAGKTVTEAAREMGFTEPCDWFGPFVAEEEGKVGIILMSMSQDDVDMVLQLPYAAVISDSLYGGGDNPHPRLYGSFPRFIREYVVERGVVSIQEAIRKMTGDAAGRMRLKNYGLLQPGYMADINVFALNEIRDKATFTESKQLSEGIRYTLIAGDTVVADGKLVEDAYAGKLVRK